jgi:hypothetical protein
VVVSRSRLTDAERGAITAALLEVVDEPGARAALDMALVERFVPVDAGMYDDIRGKLTRVRDHGLLPPSWDLGWQRIAAL